MWVAGGIKGDGSAQEAEPPPPSPGKVRRSSLGELEWRERDTALVAHPTGEDCEVRGEGAVGGDARCRPSCQGQARSIEACGTPPTLL